MDDHYYGNGKIAVFILNHLPEGEDAEVVSELNELLVKMGCGSIEVKQHEDPNQNYYYPSMCIHFNSSAAAGYLRRDAGRKPKTLIGDKRLYKISEVKKMLEDRTAEEVARDLGVSRSTLFRRLKDKHDNCYF